MYRSTNMFSFALNWFQNQMRPNRRPLFWSFCFTPAMALPSRDLTLSAPQISKWACAVCNLHHRIYREQLCFFLAIVNPKMITNRLTKEVVSYLSILLRMTIITHTSNADRIHPILGIGYFEPNNMLSLIKHR